MRNYQKIIKQVKKISLEKLKKGSSGHDYWHAYRVCKLALSIGKQEKANLKILEIASFLHDIGITQDKKDHEIKGAQFAKELLTKLNLDQNFIKKTVNCIKKHRFSKAIKAITLEEKILQDADKLDALGAIGISRLFVVAGEWGQLIYDPDIKPDFNYYLKIGASNSTINHFYDKLFKLKNLLHTKTAKKIAKNREKFMKDYLKKFYLEWNGKI